MLKPPESKGLVAILLAIAAFLIIRAWLGLPVIVEIDHQDSNGSASSNDSEYQAGRPDRQSPPSTCRDRRLGVMFSEDRRTISWERLQPYLDSRGRSAVALTAAYYISEDTRALEELMSIPADPVALFTLAQELLEPTAQLEWAKKLSAADPTSGAGGILAAKALVELGETEAAKVAFKEAILRDGMNIFLEQRQSALLDAWQFHGWDRVEARVRVWAKPEWKMRFIMTFGRIAGQTLLSPREQSVENQLDSTSYLLRLVDMTRELGEERIMDYALNAEIIETAVLSKLPPDLIFEQEEALTVADRLAELNLIGEDLADTYLQSREILRTSTPSQIDEFFALWERSGEVAARRWLIEVHSEAQTASR